MTNRRDTWRNENLFFSVRLDGRKLYIHIGRKWLAHDEFEITWSLAEPRRASQSEARREGSEWLSLRGTFTIRPATRQTETFPTSGRLENSTLRRRASVETFAKTKNSNDWMERYKFRRKKMLLEFQAIERSIPSAFWQFVSVFFVFHIRVCWEPFVQIPKNIYMRRVDEFRKN